jgi:hypothetical protein
VAVSSATPRFPAAAATAGADDFLFDDTLRVTVEAFVAVVVRVRDSDLIAIFSLGISPGRRQSLGSRKWDWSVDRWAEIVSPGGRAVFLSLVEAPRLAVKCIETRLAPQQSAGPGRATDWGRRRAANDLPLSLLLKHNTSASITAAGRGGTSDGEPWWLVVIIVSAAALIDDVIVVRALSSRRTGRRAAAGIYMIVFFINALARVALPITFAVALVDESISVPAFATAEFTGG